VTKKSNPVVYFEIPVNNIGRAIKFYKAVFNVKFVKDNIDNNEMALFPFADNNSGISGALVKGEIYKPTNDGVVIYFKTENIDKTLKLATSNGGKILYPKTDNGIGLVAEFEDTEGNRIALYQKKNNDKKQTLISVSHNVNPYWNYQPVW
jgi:predicted enzyme related to lactoylglutathione lyase